MKNKNHALCLISLLLLCSTFTAAAPYMKANPFNLNTELNLSQHYNAEITDFWNQHAQSHYFQGVDNKKIHSVSIINGHDKAIVISQGRNESVLKYKEVAYDLHQQGYDIFLIDHRGQGFSERLGGDPHRGHVAHFSDYVTDFKKYVDSLHLEQRYTQRYLMTHSMGGAIGSLYLEQYQQPFQAAVLFSPMLSINFGILPTFAAKIITASSAQFCQWFSDKPCYVPGGKGYRKRGFVGNHITHSEARFNAVQSGFELAPETQLGDATMRWLNSSITATEQAIDNAQQITIPIMLIQAGSDQIVTAQGQQAFFDNLPDCTQHQLVTIKGAKHEILLEQDEMRTPALTHALQFLQDAAACTK